jgi:hypothetical protein
MAEALERCSKASVTDLPERIKYGSTCPSHVLCGDINGRLLPEWSNPPRVEMVRRWLQTNGFAPDANELKRRWHRIFRRMRRWEQAARQEIALPQSNALFRSEATRDDYYRVIALVDDLADWCRQLAWMIASRLKTQQPKATEAVSEAPGERQEIPPAHIDAALLERLANDLTPQGYRIASYLLDQPNGVSYDTLAEIPRAFRPGPTDEAIEKALKRIGNYFNSHLDLGLSISIFPAKRRAKLIRSSDSPGDK